jgi:hypothetical protein
MAIPTYLITALICCTATQSLAQNPFEIVEGLDNRNGPIRQLADSQSLASIEAKRELTREAVVSCVEKYIDTHVKASDEVKYLWPAAHNHCRIECTVSNSAEADKEEYDNRRDQFYYNDPAYRQRKDKSVADTRHGKACSGDRPLSATLDYAAAAIKKKKDEEIDARRPALMEAMKAKLLPALDCNAKYSSLFALTTTESPENIAITAFSKCEQLFEDSAEASIDPSYGPYWHGEYKSYRIEILRETALKETTRIVVEERARQRLAPPSPPNAEMNSRKPDPKI